MRLEDGRLLRGEGRFLDDLGHSAVAAAFHRSPQAHAHIAHIDVAEVLDISGLLAVYTYDDLPEKLREPLPYIASHPGLRNPRTAACLANDRVRYVGEPVVMVVAQDRYAAEDAVEAIRIDYDPLPLVADLSSAIEAEATVHDGIPDNCAGEVGWVAGDPDGALAEAPHLLTLELRVERSAAMPLEGRGVLAAWDDDAAQLEMYSSTQVPTGVRAAVAALLQMPEDCVVVRAPDVGGAFGVKGMHPWPEELLVPWAARRLERPVKWVEDRLEHFVGSAHERLQQQRVTVGVDEDGRILGLDIAIDHDLGAYSPYGFIVPTNTAMHLSGVYRIPNGRAQIASYYTNTVPTAPYRGAGRPQAAFCIERTMDRIATELTLDRLEVRRVNLLPDLTEPYEIATQSDGRPIVYDSGSFTSAFNVLTEAEVWKDLLVVRRQARGAGRTVGVGLACYVEGTGLGPYEGAHVHIDTSGRVVASTGLSSQGQGHETTFARIVARELTVPVERVRVITGDTNRFPYAVGTFASRAAVMTGNAMVLAARNVRERAVAIAAALYEVDEGDVELRDGRLGVVGDPQKTLSLGDVAVLSNPVRDHYGSRREVSDRFGGELVARGDSRWWGNRPGLEEVAYFSSDRLTFANGVHAAIVEVDSHSCQVHVLRYIVMHDCGVVLEAEIVEGQVHGGVAQGIAGALFERIEYDEDAQLRNASFMDFLMPYSTEIPPVEIMHLETPSPLNSLGIKGAGEAGVIPVGAVIASAVEDALDHFMPNVPITPDDIYHVLYRGRESSGRTEE